MEVLEDGFVKSKDLAIKAFLRRSKARYHLQEFKEAYEDALMTKKILDKDDTEIDTHLDIVKKAYEYY